MTDVERFTPYEDNVLLRMDPVPDRTESGTLHIVQKEARRNGTRTATVLAVGPGRRGIPCWSHPAGCLLPPEVKAGDRVLVDALAGQSWSKYDRSIPRHNGTRGEMVLDQGEYRVVRESGEILAVVED